ncbi:hypothetical protein CW304_21315 [Bacillus sp. UFRGS-B20]|nr:hypothetical protein CW304_21315 [Bacillus sp. UFRGS-B20]
MAARTWFKSYHKIVLSFQRLVHTLFDFFLLSLSYGPVTKIILQKTRRYVQANPDNVWENSWK